jgi:predicted transposase YdaD
MPGPFDNATKRLLREKPQHFVSWLVPEGIYKENLSVELKSRNIYADGLFAITVNEQPALLHTEFQAAKDGLMAERLLEYSVLASSENSWLPVYTYVIYLRRDGDVPKSPLIRRLPSGEEVHRFYYQVIEVAKISAKQLLRRGLLGLLPLLPLTDGGTLPEVMQEAVTTLVEAREIELLALAYTFGGLVSGNRAYDEWFERSFAMLEDILEESKTYQEIARKGMQKGLDLGLQQGLKQGLEQGREQGLEKGLEKGREEERLQWIHEQQETLLSFVQMRFPELVSLAKQQTAPIKDPEVLHKLIVQLFGVQTAEEAKQALMEAGIQI